MGPRQTSERAAATAVRHHWPGSARARYRQLPQRRPRPPRHPVRETARLRPQLQRRPRLRHRRQQQPPQALWPAQQLLAAPAVHLPPRDLPPDRLSRGWPTRPDRTSLHSQTYWALCCATPDKRRLSQRPPHRHKTGRPPDGVIGWPTWTLPGLKCRSAAGSQPRISITRFIHSTKNSPRHGPRKTSKPRG